MNLFDSFILGLVQGLTEFIPVSSSGHLEIAQFFLGNRSQDFHFFVEMINLGTLLALLFYFRRKIFRILQDIFLRRNFRLAINILLTSIPAGLIGLLLSDFIEHTPFFSSLFTIICALGLVGFIMIVLDRIPHLKPLSSLADLPKSRALAIGFSQTLALIPGTSRSGITIIAGRLVGFDSALAAEYSFLASIPIMGAVCLKTLLSSSSRAYFFAHFPSLMFANFVAFIAGILALSFLMDFVKKPHSLRVFGFYRLCLSAILLMLVLF